MESIKRGSYDGFIFVKNDEYVFGRGKHKNELVKDHIDYAKFILTRDFPDRTKKILKDVIEEYENTNNIGNVK